MSEVESRSITSEVSNVPRNAATATAAEHAWAYSCDEDTEDEWLCPIRRAVAGEGQKKKKKKSDDDDELSRAVADQVSASSHRSRVILKPKPKVLLVPQSRTCLQKLYVRPNCTQLIRLTPKRHVIITAKGLREGWAERAGRLPAEQALRDITIATWNIGRECSPFDLGDALRRAPLEVIVITFSNGVM